jgi:hypothetical protein
MRSLLTAAVVAAALFAPTLASADETMKPITIVGRPSKPSVVIEIKRETPNIGLRPLTPPKSFMGNQ